MAFNIADRVFELTLSSGLGDLTPTGAVTGYSAFSANFVAGDMVFYMVDNLKQGGADWEIGVATYNGVDVIRGGAQTVISSSAAGSAINFPAGEKSLRVVAPADFFKGIWETHIGAVAPTWFRIGTLWTDNSNSPEYCLRQWDGSIWRTLFCYDASGIVIDGSQITGSIPASLITGNLPSSQISGTIPTSQISGKLPADQVAGNDGEFLSFDASGCGISTAFPINAIDDLSDVDVSTTVPAIGDILEWDGTNFIPRKLPTSLIQEVSSNTTEAYTPGIWNATDASVTFTSTTSLFFVYAYAYTDGPDQTYLGVEVNGTVYPLSGGTSSSVANDKGLEGAGRYISLPPGTYTANIVIFPETALVSGSAPSGSPPGVDNRYIQVIYS